MLRYRIRRFAGDEAGAVTVDWLVLTAALVTFGAVVASFVVGSSTSVASRTGTSLASATVPDLAFPGP